GTIAAAGWVNAMLLMALMSLATVPLARAFRARRQPARGDGGEAQCGFAGDRGAAPAEPSPGAADTRTDAPPALRAETARRALRAPACWLFTAGFLVCGCRGSCLTAHRRGVFESCAGPAALAGAWLAIVGACNIAGSIVSGILTQTRSMRR